MSSELSTFIAEELKQRGYNTDNEKLNLVPEHEQSTSTSNLESRQRESSGNAGKSPKRTRRFLIIGLVVVLVVVVWVALLATADKKSKDDEGVKNNGEIATLSSPVMELMSPQLEIEDAVDEGDSNSDVVENNEEKVESNEEKGPIQEAEPQPQPEPTVVVVSKLDPEKRDHFGDDTKEQSSDNTPQEPATVQEAPVPQSESVSDKSASDISEEDKQNSEASVSPPPRQAQVIVTPRTSSPSSGAALTQTTDVRGGNRKLLSN
eukprot:TRINITY_DN57424_c0_g1_i2.p1 TRINITY_DN57424_c0_g1~~TRINITY_DN57424_c0_g1_i2.p1  ORF type:complete len:278 (-),score=54.65 TRINITY_DN57424_c0_g1_i2:498-1286(-)